MLAGLELDLRALSSSFRDREDDDDDDRRAAQQRDAWPLRTLSARARLRHTPVTMTNCINLMTSGVRARDVDRARAGVVLALQIVADGRCRATATYLATRIRALYHDSVIFTAPIALLRHVHEATAPLAGGLATLGMTPTQIERVVDAVERMARADKSRLPALMTNLLGVATQASVAITNRLRARHPHLTGWFQSCEVVRARMQACVARVWNADELKQLIQFVTGAAHELVIDGVSLPYHVDDDCDALSRYLDWMPVMQGIWERGTLRTRRTMLEALKAHTVLVEWTKSSVADSEPLYIYPLFCAVEGFPSCAHTQIAVQNDDQHADDDDDDDQHAYDDDDDETLRTATTSCTK